jgi:hypothetical protein
MDSLEIGKLESLDLADRYESYGYYSIPKAQCTTAG